MKYLDTFESYEIINHRKNNNNDVYYFDTPKNKYTVKISQYQGKELYYSVGFGVRDEYDLGYDTKIVVNENPYEVMDTVFSIVKSFIKEQRNDKFMLKYNLEPIKGFVFSFTGDKIKNEQRLKLYKRSINKYFPNAILEFKNGIYYVEINE